MALEGVMEMTSYMVELEAITSQVEKVQTYLLVEMEMTH